MLGWTLVGAVGLALAFVVFSSRSPIPSPDVQIAGNGLPKPEEETAVLSASVASQGVSDQTVLHQQFRALIQRASAGHLASGREALLTEDQCATFDGRLAVQGFSVEGRAPPDGDAMLEAQWRQQLERLEVTCAAWRSVQPDPLEGRASLLRALADGARARGIAEWMASPDAALPYEAETVLTELRNTEDSDAYVEGLRRVLSQVDGGAASGLRSQGTVSVEVNLFLPDVAGCLRFGDCIPTAMERVSLCLDFYACQPHLRYDQLANSGVLSSMDSQNVLRSAHELNMRIADSAKAALPAKPALPFGQ
jgi:hypothetical protein